MDGGDQARGLHCTVCPDESFGEPWRHDSVSHLVSGNGGLDLQGKACHNEWGAVHANWHHKHPILYRHRSDQWHYVRLRDCRLQQLWRLAVIFAGFGKATDDDVVYLRHSASEDHNRYSESVQDEVRRRKSLLDYAVGHEG